MSTETTIQSEKQVPKILRLKGRRLNKTGNAYHILVPSAYVEGADLLKAGETYDVIFCPKEAFKEVLPLELLNTLSVS